jgi:hypothetical protein
MANARLLSDGKPFHLVLETPQSNLVAGMRWFLGTLEQNPVRDG